MTGCLRISRAYSLRCMKRNSTLLLIAFFIGILTIIFHLYAMRHEDQPYYRPRVGDFDYRPGAFLKGLHPSENTSYCEFNYGLPDTLKWGTFRVYKSPEPSPAKTHKVIYNAIRGAAFTKHGKTNALTYATQATPEFLYHIVEIARYWEGPISLAVFVPDYDLYITMQIMNHLCRCYPQMSKVSLHLFYPKETPPRIPTRDKTMITEASLITSTPNTSFAEILQNKIDKYKSLNEKTRPSYIQWVRQKKIERMTKRAAKKQLTPTLYFNDCAGLDSFDIPTYRRENHMLYPINVGRNVARNASWTNYFIVSDIEMVPSEGLAKKFLQMVKNLMGRKKRKEGCIFAKTIFVVPLFEIDRGEDIPRDKETLAAMVAAKRANYFHAKFCTHCQRFPGLQSWLERPPPKGVEPMMIVRREYPYHRWEPLYFGTQKEPWYSEILVWEGRQDKMTQNGHSQGTRNMRPRSPSPHLTPTLVRPSEVAQCVFGENGGEVRGRGAGTHTARDLRSVCSMLELCLQEYRFVILDGAFLSHAATATPKKENKNHPAAKINMHWYTKIVSALRKKYPDRPQCKVLWGS